MKKMIVFLLVFGVLSAFAQTDSIVSESREVSPKYRVSLPLLNLPQWVKDSPDDTQHTQHLEAHLKYHLDEKNIIGLKLATWRLFQPMGIQFWDGLIGKLGTESEFYPGHVRETGVGLTYQRMHWKGLFTTIEVLPQYQTYLDQNGKELGNDFKLYNSLHVGYRFSFGEEGWFFIEPQLHANFWMFDDNAPDGFKQLDEKWADYFLFEPNLYMGVSF